MIISRRAFLKGSARVGAAALALALPTAAYADGENQLDAMDSVRIVQSASKDSCLRITLDSVSRSVYAQQEPSCLVLLGFSVTNLTGEPVWLYHLHSNPFGAYDDGSNSIGGSFNGEPFKAQFTRNDQMAESDQTTADGSDVCIYYGVNPGDTIEMTMTGSLSSEAGTLTIAITPPEQAGANAAAHNTTHTFKVEFSQKCDAGSVQMAYL